MIVRGEGEKRQRKLEDRAEVWVWRENRVPNLVKLVRELSAIM